MGKNSLQKAIKSVSRHIKRDVASGFVELDTIVSDALEVVSDEYDADELRPHAERILREAIASHLHDQQHWPAVTDCDRFDAAFAALEEDGIVCRQNFSCCGNCASVEIWTEIKAEQDLGREVCGCAHYHCQDTESAVEGRGIYLSYGSVLRGDKAAVRVGHQIVAAMKNQGLQVEWDGSISKRIHVALDWKRRLPVDADRY